MINYNDHIHFLYLGYGRRRGGHHRHHYPGGPGFGGPGFGGPG